jgi:hypothetical protein
LAQAQATEDMQRQKQGHRLDFVSYVVIQSIEMGKESLRKEIKKSLGIGLK